jgi:pimeloyl-ACP methyl ester carboxylesterase
MWRRLLPVVARGQRVIAIDLKGFGRSDKPVDRRYRIEEHAALVRAVIAKLGLRDVTLVGYSFGGAVALLLAVDAERVGDLQVSTQQPWVSTSVSASSPTRKASY